VSLPRPRLWAEAAWNRLGLGDHQLEPGDSVASRIIRGTSPSRKPGAVARVGSQREVRSAWADTPSTSSIGRLGRRAGYVRRVPGPQMREAAVGSRSDGAPRGLAAEAVDRADAVEAPPRARTREDRFSTPPRDISRDRSGIRPTLARRTEQLSKAHRVKSRSPRDKIPGRSRGGANRGAARSPRMR